jgi:hypothetical protein
VSLRKYTHVGGGIWRQAARKVNAVGGYMYLWFGFLCVLMMESACSPLRANTRLYELQLLYSNRAGNGIGFSKGEMEVGKGMEDRAWAMAKTALEEIDEHLRTIVPPRGGGGGCKG